MPSAIQVSMTPTSLHADPGGDPVEAVITVQNTGATVDQYKVELDGLPASWYNLTGSHVALFPQDTEDARLVIRAPKGNGVQAGEHAFTVTVLSVADSTQTSRVEGTLSVGVTGSFSAEMSPKKVIGRRGRFEIVMNNSMSAPVDVELEATDGDDSCRFRFKPSAPQLTAYQRRTTRLRVRPRRFWLVGLKKPFDFQVRVTPSRGDQQTLKGQLVHMPVFQTWRPLRRLALLALVVAAIVVIWTVQPVNQAVVQAVEPFRGALCRRLHVVCAPLPPSHRYAFIGEFRAFHARHPQLVGIALQNEQPNRDGFTTQLTSNGLLVYDPTSGHAFFVPGGGTVYVYHHRALTRLPEGH